MTQKIESPRGDEYCEQMIEKHADAASMFQPETEVIETRWVRLIHPQAVDSNDVVEKITTYQIPSRNCKQCGKLGACPICQGYWEGAQLVKDELAAMQPCAGMGEDIRIRQMTIAQWQEFAKRDDCLELMVPSDLRALIQALSRVGKVGA